MRGIAPGDEVTVMARVLRITIRGGLPGGTIGRQATIMPALGGQIEMRAADNEEPTSFRASVEAVAAAVASCEGRA